MRMQCRASTLPAQPQRHVVVLAEKLSPHVLGLKRCRIPREQFALFYGTFGFRWRKILIRSDRTCYLTFLDKTGAVLDTSRVPAFQLWT